MKVTYYELVGQGTLLHPTYRAIKVDREEFCDTIMKAGNLWYMMRGGFVNHSIEVEKITKIELDGAKMTCKYNNMLKTFTCRFSNEFGYEFGAGYKDFSKLLADMRTYSKRCI